MSNFAFYDSLDNQSIYNELEECLDYWGDEQEMLVIQPRIDTMVEVLASRPTDSEAPPWVENLLTSMVCG